MHWHHHRLPIAERWSQESRNPWGNIFAPDTKGDKGITVCVSFSTTEMQFYPLRALRDPGMWRGVALRSRREVWWEDLTSMTCSIHCPCQP